MKTLFDVESALQFRGVAGDDGLGTPVIDDLSLEVLPGTSSSVRTRSCAARREFLQLVTRCVEPSRGVILLGGNDLKDIPYPELCRRIAVVSDRTPIFHGTVWENISVACTGATMARISSAAREAGLEAWAAELPHGFDSVLEEDSSLPAEFRLRLAMARAFLRSAEVVVCVEPSDSAGARAFRDLAEEDLRGHTLVFVFGPDRRQGGLSSDRVAVRNETIRLVRAA